MIRVEIKSELILQNIKNISFDKEVLSDHDIISLCKKNECFPPWVACYKISYPESILFICDPLRSIPIFYCIQKEKNMGIRLH
jgi:hypothetical protein